MLNLKVLIISIALILLGLLFSLWPLCVIGLLYAALCGQWILALMLGVYLDLLWGAPTGFWHVIAWPWTLCAAVVCVLHLLVLRQMRSEMPYHL